MQDQVKAESKLEEAPAPARENIAGLSEAEANRRLAQYGENALVEHHESAFQRLARFFWGPIPWMIEAAAVLSAVLGHWADLGIILAMLFINAGVGFWQEFKADNAIALLKQRLALQARVKRDGQWKEIEAKLLVPGDAVLVKLGNVVPADLKLVEGDYLSVDQSALTGESLPVDKKAGDEAYSGSIAKQGEMTGVVTATGMKTYFGKTAHLVEQAKSVSHFQRAVLRIGNFLILVTIGLVLVIGLAALFRRDPLMETIEFALILTVASIPVALPAVLSVTMAIGAERLAHFKAIVSRLVSIEEMAGMNMLCSDKTGTLTKNELTLGELQPASGVKREDLLLAAVLASRRDAPDAIDAAILAGASGTKLDDYTVRTFRPFDPVSKRAEAEVEYGNTRFKVVKGAPQVIVDLCEPSIEERQRISALVNQDAGKGYRTLGVARTDDSGKWRFLGLLPLFDPPRDDCAETIAATRAMGVSIKMVTGDHEAIAKDIAGQLKLGQNIVVAETLFEKGGTEPEISRIVAADGFARVFPEHKFKIVKALQRRGLHRRDDRRRRERCSRPEASRCRYCRQRGYGCRTRRRRSRADSARSFGHHHRNRGGPPHLRAHEQLRDLPHRGNHAAPAFHDGEHPDLQFLSGHRDHGGAARAPQRPPHHDDRLRQRTHRAWSRPLGYGARADHCVGFGYLWRA